MKTVIFLGAGASAADGAPIQSGLFRDYFSSSSFLNSADEMGNELKTFFLDMFRIDVNGKDLLSVKFPTFEEAIGILDLAELRRESLKGYDLATRISNRNRLRAVKIHLITAMSKIIEEKLNTSGFTHHVTLVQNLSKGGLLPDTTFISTNYDILIDNALSPSSPRTVDYTVSFENDLTPLDWRLLSSPATRLLKVHGSLNWLHCSTCNNLAFTPLTKGALNIEQCSRCTSLMTPVIIPPTFYKDMSNFFLSSIWRAAELAIRDSDRIIFCGYSFPDADMHLKYLIKRAETNRSSPFVVSVLNDHPKKTDSERRDEEERYRRFLQYPIKYQPVSFEQFAASPDKFY